MVVFEGHINLQNLDFLKARSNVVQGSSLFFSQDNGLLKS